MGLVACFDSENETQKLHDSCGDPPSLKNCSGAVCESACPSASDFANAGSSSSGTSRLGLILGCAAGGGVLLACVAAFAVKKFRDRRYEAERKAIALTAAELSSQFCEGCVC
eukprot:gene42132-65936_t